MAGVLLHNHLALMGTCCLRLRTPLLQLCSFTCVGQALEEVTLNWLVFPIKPISTSLGSRLDPVLVPEPRSCTTIIAKPRGCNQQVLNSDLQSCQHYYALCRSSCAFTDAGDTALPANTARAPFQAGRTLRNSLGS